MKKISILLLCVLCALFIGGCWDKKELEDNTFAVLLGIDAGEDDGIIVTVAFPLTQTGGSDSAMGAQKEGATYTVMSVKAPNMAQGLDLFSAKLSGPLVLYTVKTIVISQEVAQSDMLRQVFPSWRYEDVRNTTNVLVSQCTAEEFIQARIKDPLIDPLRQEELLLEQANGSANYKPIGLLDLVTDLKSGGGDGVAMYGGISGKTGEDSPSPADMEQVVQEGYLPSEVPISTQNNTQISGLAVFRGEKMVGVLNSLESQTYAMLTQDSTHKLLTMPDPLDPRYDVVVSVLPTGKTQIRGGIRDGIPVFTIDVRLTCAIECTQSQVDYTLWENNEVLTEHIKTICAQNMADLIRKAMWEFNADIFKLGDKLIHHFATIGQWESFGWPENYQNSQITLNVTIVVT